MGQEKPHFRNHFESCPIRSENKNKMIFIDQSCTCELLCMENGVDSSRNVREYRAEEAGSS